jgi:hypothetical protein
VIGSTGVGIITHDKLSFFINLFHDIEYDSSANDPVFCQLQNESGVYIQTI